MELKKMQNLSEKYISKFTKAATELVMDEVTNTDEENKKTIIMFTARDMAIGAMMKRNEHILTGVGIGVIGTSLAFAIGSKFKKVKEEIIQTDKDGLGREEEVLEEQEEAFNETSAAEAAVTEEPEEVNEIDEETESIMDKVHDILKKPSNLDDLKSVIEELRRNEK